MKKYIFYTSEGLTQTPDNDDIENCQVIDWAKGKNSEEAFRNMKNESKHLKETDFDEVMCQELVNNKVFHFSLKS